eukprot:7252472-Prymnesium_polylepis.2
MWERDIGRRRARRGAQRPRVLPHTTFERHGPDRSSACCAAGQGGESESDMRAQGEKRKET